MKERKFVRGIKSARMSGTKTAFRNYRKALIETGIYNVPYRSAYGSWLLDRTSQFNP